MSIERIDAFKYRGRVFESEQKAIDYAETLVADAIRAPLTEKGFTVSEWMKIVQTILDKREALIDLLDY